MNFLCCLLLVCLSWSFAGELKPEHVAVVYNTRSDFSKECALRYAKLRGVPEGQVVGISCEAKEEISRKEFEEGIESPLLREAGRRNWWLPTRMGRADNGTGPEVHVLALMPDLPLKVREDVRPQGKGWIETTAASVDSELALFGSGNVSGKGMLMNPYFKQDEDFVMSGYPLLLVSRIEAPSKEACRRMIEDPAQVEGSGGLWGWLVVDAGGPYAEGDRWMNAIAAGGRSKGVPVLLDAVRETLPSRFPLPAPVAAYFGWYAGDLNGPFADAGFRFAKGAVAVHLHSFSAATLKSSSRGWSGPILEKGAAVTLGNVYEPFLGGSHHLDVFYDRLLKGYSVAEAAAMAMPALSWQGVVLGDPLYRPFAGMKVVGMKKSRDARFFQAWFVAGNMWGKDDAVFANEVEKAAGKPGNGVLWEFLGCRALAGKDYGKAVWFLSRALPSAASEGDQVRLQLLLADAYKGNRQEEECVGQLRRLLLAYGASPYAPAIREKAKAFPVLRILTEDPAVRSSKVK